MYGAGTSSISMMASKIQKVVEAVLPEFCQRPIVVRSLVQPDLMEIKVDLLTPKVVTSFTFPADIFYLSNVEERVIEMVREIVPKMFLQEQLPARLRGRVLIRRVTDPFLLSTKVTFTLPNKHSIECVLGDDNTIPSDVLAKICLLA